MYDLLCNIVKNLEEKVQWMIKEEIKSKGYLFTSIWDMYPKLARFDEAGYKEHKKELESLLFEELQSSEVKSNSPDHERVHRGCSWEKMVFIIKRWRKLKKDLKKKDGTFDTTKIPTIYDMLKYDLIHNYPLIGELVHEFYERILLLS